MVAALRLAMRACGATGVRWLLKRSLDFRRMADKQCFMPDLLMPVVSIFRVANDWCSVVRSTDAAP